MTMQCVLYRKGSLTMYSCEDTAISGIPNGYAATDWCDACTVQGNKHRLQRVFLRIVSNIWTNLPEWEPNVKVEGNSATIEGVEKLSRSKSERTGSRAQERHFVLQDWRRKALQLWTILYISREDMRDSMRSSEVLARIIERVES